jgi:hypothetical protein
VLVGVSSAVSECVYLLPWFLDYNYSDYSHMETSNKVIEQTDSMAIPSLDVLCL